MNILVLSLAFGCTLQFSDPDREATARFGDEENGALYKRLTHIATDGAARLLEDDNGSAVFSGAPFFDVGPSPDKLYASYVVFVPMRDRTLSYVRFIAAKDGSRVEFVYEADGRALDQARYAGWDKTGHRVRMRLDANTVEYAIPREEYAARARAPGQWR